MESVDIISPICDISIMRDHHDRVARLSMERIDEIHDPSCVPLIEITRGFISEEILDIRNKSPSNCHSLLLSTR